METKLRIEPKFFIGLCFTATALMLELGSPAAFGSYVSFALAALVVLALFLDVLEILALALITVFVLGFRPAASPEFLLFIALPLGAFFVRRMFPSTPWLTGLVLVGISVFALYFFADARYLLTNPGTFAVDEAGSLAFGSVVFFLMHWAVR